MRSTFRKRLCGKCGATLSEYEAGKCLFCSKSVAKDDEEEKSDWKRRDEEEDW
jgi:ribosomal protein L40E